MNRPKWQKRLVDQVQQLHLVRCCPGELAAPQYAGAAPAAAPQHVGCIDPNCDVATIVRDAFNNAAFLCDQVYLQAPDLRLKVEKTLEIMTPQSRC